jgi:hypothetical protein
MLWRPCGLMFCRPGTPSLGYTGENAVFTGSRVVRREWIDGFMAYKQTCVAPATAALQNMKYERTPS